MADANPLFYITVEGRSVPVYAPKAASVTAAANAIAERAYEALARAHGSTGLVDPELLGGKRDGSGEISLSAPLGQPEQAAKQDTGE